MITLFLLDGFLLWWAVGIWAILLGCCVYAERYSLATVDVVAFVALMALTGNFHPGDAWQYCLHNPVLVIGGTLGYLAAGVVWARIKWSLLTSRLKVQIDAWRETNRKTNESNQRAYAEALAEYEANREIHDKPCEPSKPEPRTVVNTSMPYELIGQVSVNGDGLLSIVFERFKSRIMGWIGYWPMSVILWLVGDFVHDVLEQIVRLIRAHFVRSADQKLNG